MAGYIDGDGNGNSDSDADGDGDSECSNIDRTQIPTLFAQRTTDIVLLFSSPKRNDEGRDVATLQAATAAAASVKHLGKQREAPAKGTLPAAIISVTSIRSRTRTSSRSRTST